MKTCGRTKCRECGEAKSAREILCRPCWLALPASLRMEFNTAKDSGERIAAVRAIYDRTDGTPSFL